ncbi:MAG: type II secretion system F family protein [Candidatus Dormibacteraeota bacterium]|nr:type II secretion system F family protein [Candidatus Dormibacteraeota bacterium]
MSLISIVLEAVGALGIFGAVAALGLSRTRTREGDLDARLQRFAEAGAGMVVNMPTREVEEEAPAARGPLSGLLQRFRGRQSGAALAAQRSRNANLSEALARADVKLRPAEWYLIRIGTVLVLALLGFALYHNAIFALILAVVGFFVPPLVLRFRERKRSRAFNDQLGDVLILLSNGLKAGYSFPQAMASIARSANPPVAEEFARATREIQLGITTDEALGHMVTRIRSEDLDLVVTAVGIQRVVGGNLAEILDNIAFTIRERVRIKGEIRTLTAQARASSYIITGLPIALALILQAINPAYIAPLLSFKGPGPYVLIGCGISIGFAFYVMQRIANIEV